MPQFDIQYCQCVLRHILVSQDSCEIHPPKEQVIKNTFCKQHVFLFQTKPTLSYLFGADDKHHIQKERRDILLPPDEEMVSIYSIYIETLLHSS